MIFSYVTRKVHDWVENVTLFCVAVSKSVSASHFPNMVLFHRLNYFKFVSGQWRTEGRDRSLNVSLKTFEFVQGKPAPVLE
jgi:hypothetical protein